MVPSTKPCIPIETVVDTSFFCEEHSHFNNVSFDEEYITTNSRTENSSTTETDNDCYLPRLRPRCHQCRALINIDSNYKRVMNLLMVSKDIHHFETWYFRSNKDGGTQRRKHVVYVLEPKNRCNFCGLSLQCINFDCKCYFSLTIQQHVQEQQESIFCIMCKQYLGCGSSDCTDVTFCPVQSYTTRGVYWQTKEWNCSSSCCCYGIRKSALACYNEST